MTDDDIVRARRNRLIALALAGTTAGLAGCSEVAGSKAERPKQEPPEAGMSLEPAIPPPPADMYPFCPPPPRERPDEPEEPPRPCLSVF